MLEALGYVAVGDTAASEGLGAAAYSESTVEVVIHHDAADGSWRWRPPVCPVCMEVAQVRRGVVKRMLHILNLNRISIVPHLLTNREIESGT